MALLSRHSDWWARNPPPPSSLRAKHWSLVRFMSGGADDMALSWRHFDKPGAQFVYFIEYGRIVKVGISKYPWFRFSVIENELRRYPGYAHIVEAAGASARLELNHVSFGGMGLETAIHRYLMRDWVSGEWFWRGRRVRRVIQHLTAQNLLFSVDEVYPLKTEARHA